jgi:hypothetical protein
MNPIKILILALLVSACTSTNESRSSNVSNLPSPASEKSAEPFLFTSQDGQVYMSWVEQNDTTSTLRYSKLVNGAWIDPINIDGGSNWFVNWADYPMMAVNGSNLIAHYLQKSGEGTYAYDVKVTLSNDKGTSWHSAFTLNDDGKEAEHGFASIVPYNDNFFVAWLDGRNTAMESSEHHGGHDGHHGQMSLRAAIVDGTGKKLEEWQLDNRTCDCCQTTAAITRNGPVVVYRDRSRGEIRDISIVRYVNGTWTDPKSIHPDKWKIEGCPVNGPRIDARGDDLVVAWYTLPGKTSAVNVSFSNDNGETFTDPIRVDDGKAIGRVDVVMLPGNSAMVSWMEGTLIRAVKVNADGTKGEPVTIASSSESRSSGFPQMTLWGDQLLFAWTDDSAKTIRTATFSLKDVK